MKVHLIKRQTIEDFVKANVQSKRSFENWLAKVKHADWKLPADMQATYGSADLLGDGSNRIVFNIGGNNYRMIFFPDESPQRKPTDEGNGERDSSKHLNELVL